jgi:hypothetical protein
MLQRMRRLRSSHEALTSRFGEPTYGRSHLEGSECSEGTLTETRAWGVDNIYP